MITFLLLSYPETIVAEERVDETLGKYFENYQGTFVLVDSTHDIILRYNPEMAKARTSPCSTFKIPNSLIGLETGVIADENTIIKWDGKKRPVPAWNKDHSLKTAIADSVVWFYQELAYRIGPKRMKKYISAIAYGNEDISGGITRFWLQSSLKISADEQVDFLRRLVKEDLPFSKRTMNIVKNITILKETDQSILRGKTGSGLTGDEWILGWFVGYVTLKSSGDVYIFATRIEGTGARGAKARDITEEILKSRGLL